MTSDRLSAVAALFADDVKARAAVADLTRSGVLREAILLGVRSPKRMHTLTEELGTTPLPHAAHATGLFTEIARVSGVHDENEDDITDELLDRGIDEERAVYFDEALTGDFVLLVLAGADATPERIAIFTRLRADLGLENKGGAVSTIPVRAELLDVSKRVLVDNEIVIRTEVITERRSIEVELIREEVVIERRSVTGGTPEIIRFPTKHEEVQVQKQTVVTSEVIVRTDQFVEVVTVEETVRHEVVTVDEPRPPQPSR